MEAPVRLRNNHDWPFLVLTQRGIEQRPHLERESATMCALHQASFIEYFQVLANRDLRSPKLSSEICDDNPVRSPSL